MTEKVGAELYTTAKQLISTSLRYDPSEERRIQGIYSRDIPRLTEMVKALYKELQELLKPGEKVDIHSFGRENVLWKLNKDSVIMNDNQTISVEKYIEESLSQHNGKQRDKLGDDQLKFNELYALFIHINNLEKSSNVKLTGKYL